MNLSLKEKFSRAPNCAGVYLHKDKNKRVIYVGKAAKLHNRLTSYTSSPTGTRLNDLINDIDDCEYIVTDSEQDALILENALIKEHYPKYNIRLKDDKSYPYIKVDMREDFPRVYITRTRTDTKALYFGPYATGASIRKAISLLNKLFPYRVCSKIITGTDAHPCLEYHIKRCIAPCTGYASRSEYMQVIKQMVSFLQYGPQTVTAQLKKEMRAASNNLDYERAAMLRDRIKNINSLMERKTVAALNGDSFDAIALAGNNINAWAHIFLYRKGVMTGRDKFVIEGVEGASNAHLMSAFVKQYYSLTNNIPRLILCSSIDDEADSIMDWLSAKANRRVKLQVPTRGHKQKIIKMVERNAMLAREIATQNQLRNAEFSQKTLQDLQDVLSLPALPRRIECYDISHTQGTFVVASMSVFQDGKPHTAHYRQFKLRVEAYFNDDFAAMKAVLTRRLKYLQSSNKETVESFGEWPDLILIDGGKGQLSAAQEAVLNSGLSDVYLAAIAKKEETVYLPDYEEPLHLSHESPALQLLQNARDEAHRFALKFHRAKRAKSSMTSRLDTVSGIGPKRRKALLRRFGSPANIKTASLSEIATTPGITESLAIRLKELL